MYEHTVSGFTAINIADTRTVVMPGLEKTIPSDIKEHRDKDERRVSEAKGEAQKGKQHELEAHQVEQLMAHQPSIKGYNIDDNLSEDPNTASAAETYFKPVSPHAPPELKNLLRKSSWAHSRVSSSRPYIEDTVSLSTFKPEMQSSTDLGRNSSGHGQGDDAETKQFRAASSDLSAIAQFGSTTGQQDVQSQT